jgi:hypothetical protein
MKKSPLGDLGVNELRKWFEEVKKNYKPTPYMCPLGDLGVKKYTNRDARIKQTRNPES